MELHISNRVRKKLSTRHGVHQDEIHQCFTNRHKGFIEDIREEHKTNPPTLWFVAETNFGKKLKIMFMFKEGEIHIKSAYVASDEITSLYERLA